MIGSSRLNQMEAKRSLASCRPLAASRRSHRIMAYSTPTEIDANALYKSLSTVMKRLIPSPSRSTVLLVSKPPVAVPPPHLHITDLQTRLHLQADIRNSLKASVRKNLAVYSSPMSPTSGQPRNPMSPPAPRYIKMPDGCNIVISPSTGSTPPSQIATAMLSYSTLRVFQGSSQVPSETPVKPSTNLVTANAA